MVLAPIGPIVDLEYTYTYNAINVDVNIYLPFIRSMMAPSRLVPGRRRTYGRPNFPSESDLRYEKHNDNNSNNNNKKAMRTEIVWKRRRECHARGGEISESIFPNKIFNLYFSFLPTPFLCP